MDWFSWLSKTNLEPSLVYEYGLIFAHNELEEQDTSYFNHEFLQSMGISIAKHRLQILKLAKKNKGFSRLFVAIKRTTKRCISKYVPSWVNGEEKSLVLVPKRDSIWKRKKKVLVGNQGRLLLTNGSPLMVSHPSKNVEKMKVGDHHVYNWSSVVEEFRWDTMFQDLKPT